ncbi:MAG: hypothetical protein ISS36_02460 [Candidatus Aenigmarchaeota archaeon]|nr:hypothetical protein [Candidatus Aenigmarchaeota archaeon]
MDNKIFFGVAGLVFILLALPVYATDVSVDVLTVLPDTITSPQEFSIDVNITNIDELEPAWDMNVVIEGFILETGDYYLINKTNISVLYTGDSVLLEDIVWNVNKSGEHLLIVSASLEYDINRSNNIVTKTLNFTPDGMDIATEIVYDDILKLGERNIIPIYLTNLGSVSGSVQVILNMHSITNETLFDEIINVEPGEELYLYANSTPTTEGLYLFELMAINDSDVIQENNFQNKTLTTVENPTIDIFVTDRNDNNVADNIYVEIPDYLINQHVENNISLELPEIGHNFYLKKYHENTAVVIITFDDVYPNETMRLVFEDVVETELEIIGFKPSWNYSKINIYILGANQYLENISNIDLHICSAWNFGSNTCSNWQQIEPTIEQTILFYSSIEMIQGLKLTENITHESEPVTQGTPGSTGTTAPPSGGVIPQTPNTTNTTNVTTNVTTNITEPVANITAPVCAEGDRVCAGNSLQTCKNNEWKIDVCPNGCNSLTKVCKEKPIESIVQDNTWVLVIIGIVVLIVAVIMMFRKNLF